MFPREFLQIKATSQIISCLYYSQGRKFSYHVTNFPITKKFMRYWALNVVITSCNNPSLVFSNVSHSSSNSVSWVYEKLSSLLLML